MKEENMYLDHIIMWLYFMQLCNKHFLNERHIRMQYNNVKFFNPSRLYIQFIYTIQCSSTAIKKYILLTIMSR